MPKARKISMVAAVSAVVTMVLVSLAVANPRQQAVRSRSQFRIQPIEVINRVQPIGVPVASYGAAYYAQRVGNEAPFMTDVQLATLVDRLAEILETRRHPPSVVTQLCFKCHSSGKGAEHFEIPDVLDGSTRLRMLASIVTTDPTKRMPKGKVLSPAAMTALIRELAIDPASGAEQQNQSLVPSQSQVQEPKP